MDFLARFRVIEDKDKAAVVRKLMESSTPNFDFFYLTALSVIMATFGVIINSTSIVIGSMLIAPVLYPILGVALGLSMSNTIVLQRSLFTLGKALSIGLGCSILAALFLGDGLMTAEILSRTTPSLIHFLVAVVSGAAVAFALANPEWSSTLPGVAISVALIPPLAVVGVGIAYLDIAVIKGSSVLLIMNLFGVVFAAMVSFSLMNLYDKQGIATSTIKKQSEIQQKEQAAIAKEISNDELARKELES